MSDDSRKPFYKVLQVVKKGELDTTKSAEYSKAVTATNMDDDIDLFLTAHPEDLKKLLDADPNVIGYKEVGTADAYGRIIKK